MDATTLWQAAAEAVTEAAEGKPITAPNRTPVRLEATSIVLRQFRHAGCTLHDAVNAVDTVLNDATNRT